MIPVELWRARIGGFSRNNCSSGSRSSLFAQLREYCTSSAVASSTVGLASNSSGSIAGQAEKHSTASFSAEHGFFSAVLIKQLRLSFVSLSSFSPSSSDRSRNNVFQYDRSPQLRDVLIILLTMIVHVHTVISQLLIISGDIETNPGPVRGGEQDT